MYPRFDHYRHRPNPYYCGYGYGYGYNPYLYSPYYNNYGPPIVSPYLLPQLPPPPITPLQLAYSQNYNY